MPFSAGAVKAGRAYVEAFLDKDQVEKGLRDLQGNLRSFSRNVTAIGAGFTALGGAIVAPLAAATLAFARAGDELDKMSKRTGVSVETLSALDFAASQSGTSIDAVEKGLRGMFRTLLDAERGLTTATDNLEDLGLTLDQLQGRSPEEQFRLFAERIAAIDDPSRRAAVAMKVFGRSGTELLPLLENGSDGIQDLMDRAEELGLVLSQEDAAAAAELTDTLDELKRAAKAVALAVGRELAPLVTDLAAQIVDIIPRLQQWISDNRELIVLAAQLGAGLLGLGGALIGIGTAARAAAAGIGVVNAAMALNPATALAIGLSALIAVLVGYAAAARQAEEAQRRFNEQQRQAVTDQLLQQSRAIQDPVERQQFLRDEIARIREDIRASTAVGGVPNPGTPADDLLQRRQERIDILSQELQAAIAQEEQLAAAREESARAAEEAAAAEQAAREEAARAAEEARLQAEREAREANVTGIIDDLQRQIEDFGLGPIERQLQELERLGATPEQLEAAGEMAEQLKELQAASDESPEAFRAAVSPQAGTFSGLASRIFGAGGGVEEQQLDQLKQIARHTKTITRQELVFGE